MDRVLGGILGKRVLDNIVEEECILLEEDSLAAAFRVAAIAIEEAEAESPVLVSRQYLENLEGSQCLQVLHHLEFAV